MIYMMTSEEIYFYIDNRETEISKDFAFLVSVIKKENAASQSREGSDVEGQRRIARSEDVSSETEVKIIHTLSS